MRRGCWNWIAARFRAQSLGVRSFRAFADDLRRHRHVASRLWRDFNTVNRLPATRPASQAPADQLRCISTSGVIPEGLRPNITKVSS